MREVASPLIMPGQCPADYRDPVPEVWRGSDDGEGRMIDGPGLHQMAVDCIAANWGSSREGWEVHSVDSADREDFYTVRLFVNRPDDQRDVIVGRGLSIKDACEDAVRQT